MRLGVEAAIVRGELVSGDVAIEGGVVSEVGLGGGGSGIAAPGLVDLQVNGYAGVDLLNEPERAVEVAEALARVGTTSWQPTLITSPADRMREATRVLADVPGSVGVHLEGPFLSSSKSGAHPVEHLRTPDLELLRSLLEAGPVATVTLAPELPGALTLVDELVERSVVVSLGHTEATAAEADTAFAHGASTVTHLFNAMRTFHHRDPGVIGAALARPEIQVQLIADGVHVTDESLLVAWSAARGRFAVVSDAIAAAGLGDGTYLLGEVEVHVEQGVCSGADGTLAGSASSVLDGVRTLVRLGIPLADAIGAATTVPARILRRADLGRLEPGAPADIVVLDDRLDIVQALRRDASFG